MLDELFDRAWSCFNKMDKKPPDRNANPTMLAETLKRRSSIAGPMVLDPSVLPDRQKLDSEFKQLLQELDLNPTKENELCNQSAEKKWVMILEHQIRQSNLRSAAANPSTTIQRLQEWSRFFPDKYTIPLAVQLLEDLAISLRTENISYVQKFIELDGIIYLTRILAETRNGADCIALPILSCFKALLNSSTAQKFVLERSDTLLSVVGAIDYSKNSKCQLLALEILGGLCLVPERGHYAVLKAITDATTILGERTRFQKLIDELHKEHGTARETERVRVAIMSLLNALLKVGPAEQLDFRLHLRYELLLQGLDKVIEGIRDEHGQDMENHLDFFDMQRKDDEDELLSLSSNDSNLSPPNLLTVTGLAEALNQKLDKTVAQKHLLSILEHLLILSVDENHLQLWKLYDLILQQLSLQLRMQNVKNVGDEVDAALAGQSLDINVDRIMTKLRSEEECQRLEKECMDKDKRILELENRLSDLQDGFSLSSFSRSSDLGSSSSEVCHSPTPSSSSSVPLVVPKSMPMAPPPPPMASQLRSLGGPILNPTAPKKKVPKPMSQVKTLNWTTIPHTKIGGTVFENIGDEKLYDKLNLQQICTTFASNKDPGDPGTLHRRIARAAETVPSVIEFRRSQNLNIMLSKLKMSHREIRTTILSMDEKSRLPRDMIEQMLKFIPTKDELSALDESLAKCSSPSSLPLADRYLFEVGQIPRFEQRLKCLNIMRSFQERVDSLKPFMNSVTKASTTLSSSNRLKQLMSLLLAIGNYLNFGKRNGNAMGFTIRSLNTVQDVKSVLKADRTLLHYIVELIEQQFPDLIKLKKDLNLLYDATKFTRAETEQEMLDIQAALRYVSNQYNEHLQQQKQKSSENSTEEVGNDSGVEIVVPSGDPKAQIKKTDKFLPTVKAFLNTANKQMSDLEQLSEEMKTKFTICAAYFCEDSTNTSPDEFFRVFTKFLSQFADCHATVLKERENVEREKRQTISRTMLQRKYGKKQRESGPQIFDMLVSELTKGELFRDDLTRLSQKYPWKKKVTSVQINA